MSAHPWSTVQYVLFYSLNARIFFQSLKCYTYYGPTDYQTNNRRVPAEFFPADIRLRFRLAVFFFGGFSADRNSAPNPDIGYGWVL